MLIHRHLSLIGSLKLNKKTGEPFKALPVLLWLFPIRFSSRFQCPIPSALYPNSTSAIKSFGQFWPKRSLIRAIILSRILYETIGRKWRKSWIFYVCFLLQNSDCYTTRFCWKKTTQPDKYEFLSAPYTNKYLAHFNLVHCRQNSWKITALKFWYCSE